MRIELEDTALVRPSKEDSPRGAGSAGSTRIADRPLESSAAASASPTSPPPKMITSARSTAPALIRCRCHGERSEAIHALVLLDCFVADAPRNDMTTSA